MVAKPKCKYRIVYNNTRRGKIRRYGDRSRYSNEVKRNLVFMKNNVHEGSGVYRYIYTRTDSKGKKFMSVFYDSRLRGKETNR